MATQNFCSFHGSIMLESQMAIPTQLQQDVTASNILQCDFPCPGVPAESEIHYQMSYRNEDGFQFLAGAMAHANAKLIVKYNQNAEDASAETASPLPDALSLCAIPEEEADPIAKRLNRLKTRRAREKPQLVEEDEHSL
ncbi:hypothetical protein VTN49DRAFT_3318 [Thermomyces lanuginosus]|uniref:uncharacterized protein n=1 Tax=Thermomyces lanuginosus TaxID=5541 RepID=UPI003743DD88